MTPTSWTFQRPHRTLGMRLFNAVGRGLRRLGLRPRLNADDILARARRKARLDDFGDERFLEPLRILVKSCEDDDELMPLGRFVTRLRLTHFAVNRLRVQHALKTHS